MNLPKIPSRPGKNKSAFHVEKYGGQRDEFAARTPH